MRQEANVNKVENLSTPYLLICPSFKPPNLWLRFYHFCTTFVMMLDLRESEAELFAAHQFVLATSPLRFTTANFIFQLNTCRHIPNVTSSLTRGCVCRIQLLLVLASAVNLMSESRGTHDHILLSQIWDSANLKGQIPVFIYPSGHLVPFSSPSTAHRATMKVSDPPL
jgi:hypothetical protein